MTQLTINSDQVAYVEIVVRVDPSLDSVYRVGLDLASGKQLPRYEGPTRCGPGLWSSSSATPGCR